MGQYFADIHADTTSQLLGQPCHIKDTPAVTELRTASSYDKLLELAKALCWQLRYREAVDVYTRAIALNPENPAAYRQRAARYIATLQPEKAIPDLQYCRKAGGDAMDLSYRLGICYYLAGDYQNAICEFDFCYPLCGEEMGIAAIYWHTLSAWRCKKYPALLDKYHLGMQVGHHISYDRVAALASGRADLTTILKELRLESDDMHFSILSYGVSQYLMHLPHTYQADAMIKETLSHDRFWITYAYLAAWNDAHT